ncbi:CpsD/CapB family tyrosine-protein kinase [Albimonas sp. CAU 1670]|uniref:CpsD/CapB family tyrosine-protein kinase n=1 Tax=Albimonas sp. CAU 1670 TaxID=3032599 RepID=UPI0023DC34B6|nr:CpsD/CapB family tyrosine-protein kinase [Albimonas sp. CAU 1670]MDF2233863.1 CpsD/CapB family tyrosine-protein kinase [Albimonas sp. CAU 1670]
MERIKAAINRAKQARAATLGDEPVPPPRTDFEDYETPPGWLALQQIEPDEEVLTRNRIVTFTKDDPAHVPFDILRTKILRMMEANNWKKIAVTSPTMSCGKTMIATNLAFSFARQRNTRCVICDVDLKRPQVRKVIGLESQLSMGDYLMGGVRPEEFFIRMGDNLAVGPTSQSFRHSAELLQHPDAAEALEEMDRVLKPDVTIFDLPPMLASDDAMSFMNYVDCALLIAAAGTTKVRNLDDCERQLSEMIPIAGVILNKYALNSESYSYYEYDYM